jgi:hypothetical protein
MSSAATMVVTSTQLVPSKRFAPAALRTRHVNKGGEQRLDAPVAAKNRKRNLGRDKRRRNGVVVVNDRMQSSYSYLLTEPMGCHFDPEFRPDLSPEEMLALGVFGGKYLTDCRREFPASWFAHAKLSPPGRDRALNYSASTLASRFRYGAEGAGFIGMIPAAGSSGIAATTWAARAGRGRAADQALEGDPPSRGTSAKTL